MLAAARLELDNKAGAWSAAERDHGRALADLLFAAERRRLTAAESAREVELKGALGDLERELAAYQKASLVDTTEEAAQKFEKARSRLLSAELEWRAFQAEITRKYPITEGQIYPLDRVQASLDNKTALIGWLDADVKDDDYISWVYVVRQRGPVIWARLATPEEGRGLHDVRARLLREALASPAALQSGTRLHARQLWVERFAPISRALNGVEHLVVIPSGVMLGIPVESLIDKNGTYLCDKYAISYTPSATIHAWLAERSRTNDRNEATLLVGDPPFDETHLIAPSGEEETPSTAKLPSVASILAGNEASVSSLPRLPATRHEVTSIASIVPLPRVFLGSDASEQKLAVLASSGKIKGFNVIHIATHALIDNERPGRSALVLSQVGLPDPLQAAKEGRRIHDGFVTATEIVGEWDLSAELVTLSACETGLGRVVRGEGYIGFSHAFLQSGARSLLASLWKVEDRATALLMQRFYENLFRERDVEGHVREEHIQKAIALQEAKQWLRNYTNADGEQPFAHPYYWSAFILIGDRE